MERKENHEGNEQCPLKTSQGKKSKPQKNLLFGKKAGNAHRNDFSSVSASSSRFLMSDVSNFPPSPALDFSNFIRETSLMQREFPFDSSNLFGSKFDGRSSMAARMSRRQRHNLFNPFSITTPTVFEKSFYSSNFPSSSHYMLAQLPSPTNSEASVWTPRDPSSMAYGQHKLANVYQSINPGESFERPRKRPLLEEQLSREATVGQNGHHSSDQLFDNCMVTKLSSRSVSAPPRASSSRQSLATGVNSTAAPRTLTTSRNKKARNTSFGFERTTGDQSQTSNSLLKNILEEMKFATGRMKSEDTRCEMCNDWKFAAMVVDRTCLWFFTLFTLGSTAVIFISAPNVVHFWTDSYVSHVVTSRICTHVCVDHHNCYLLVPKLHLTIY